MLFKCIIFCVELWCFLIFYFKKKPKQITLTRTQNIQMKWIKLLI